MNRRLTSACLTPVVVFALGCGAENAAPKEGHVDSGLPDHVLVDVVTTDHRTITLPHDAGESDAVSSPPNDAGHEAAATTCSTLFVYSPPAGTTPSTVSVTGEWNAFASPGVPLVGPDAKGNYSAAVALDAGLVAYKFLVDGTYTLDKSARWEKYVGGVENSATQVVDCHLPTLANVSNATSRPSSGHGQFVASVAFTAGAGASGIDPASVTASLRSSEGSSTATSTVDASGTLISIRANNLADGKYTVFVNAKDLKGQTAAPLRLVFWVEAEAFDWQDALIYMAVTDRFKDAVTSNDAPATTNVDPREDFQGGDYAGVAAKINDGTFDALGVRVLWLTPYNTNPSDAWVASDNVHMTMGYHGYWPIKAREVDARWGGADELHAMITAAHAHGIRVIQDVVAHHIHQEHEYNAAHPDWFKSGCICGTDNCDWTVHRLDCIFEPYMPNVDWTNPDVDAQYEADSIWWADQFDLDGFRIDAVKQVPDIAIINLTAAIRGEFEPSGLRFFMTGETAMGWDSSCGLACNATENYDIVSEYIGPHGLDGQFDFPLYYSVPMVDFAASTYGMTHVDYWTQASGWEYPAGSMMSPYIGSQDTARFVSIADFNNHEPTDGTSPYNQWASIAEAPASSAAYGQLRGAMTWMLGLPGVPMIYYGDEYGQFGGVDPNNRLTWRGDGVLNADEQATLSFVQKLGQARKNLVALRRGAYQSVYSTFNILVYGRQTEAGEVALVALSTATTSTTFTTALPVTMLLANGTVLHDQLGGPDVTVAEGAVTLTLGPAGSAILAP